MVEKIIKILDGFDNNEKQRFYTSFSRNLTISVRGIWSEQSYSNETKIKMMKIINECQHRILNHVLSLYKDESNWTDSQIFKKIQVLVEKDSSVAAEVGGALNLTLSMNDSFEEQKPQPSSLVQICQ